jgi:sulfoxide reductase heme-binding subunit YedZ
MSHDQALRYIWWLVSRASGIVALLLISLSVALGLAMAATVLKGAAVKRAGARLHEQLALTGLAAIAVHGLALLGDRWLRPGWRGITIPFELGYRPAFTGIGIIAGYVGLLLGPSFYLRRRIGARRWRKLHRTIVIVWILSAVHAVGAGSDADKVWLRVLVLIPVAPIVYLLVVRTIAPERRAARRAARVTRDDPQPRQRRPDDHLIEPLEVASELGRSRPRFRGR